jgi:hypothetical protein
MLNQLFEHDITVSQLFERQKNYTNRITSLRTLRNLTAQMSKQLGESEDLARLAKHEEEVGQSIRDAEEAHADSRDY